MGRKKNNPNTTDHQDDEGREPRYEDTEEDEAEAIDPFEPVTCPSRPPASSERQVTVVHRAGEQSERAPLPQDSHSSPSETRNDQLVNGARGYHSFNTNTNRRTDQHEDAAHHQRSARMEHSASNYYGGKEGRGLIDRMHYEPMHSPLHSSRPNMYANNHQCRMQRHTPGQDVKIPPFSGKEDWEVWINRFEVIAERYQWDEDEMIKNLLPRLQGNAGAFVFTQIPRWLLYNYKELVTELNSQFRVIETQKSFAAKFSRRDQKGGETAEEYAAQLKRLYAKAYSHRGHTVRQDDLVRRFFDGLRDSEAKFEVEFHKEPQNIDEAVFHVVRFIQTRQVRKRDPYGGQQMKRCTRKVWEEVQSDTSYDSNCEQPEDEDLEVQLRRGKEIQSKSTIYETRQKKTEGESRAARATF